LDTFGAQNEQKFAKKFALDNVENEVARMCEQKRRIAASTNKRTKSGGKWHGILVRKDGSFIGNNLTLQLSFSNKRFNS
jgi:hypothetical protein